ncbi:hypothetical protein [Paraflavitalea pollutisoli]|uniref:hypothetical protein n=1 Tax=Paraflavitalea pollutisoli TaxID=3034143 RepID=UPI0023EE0B35|nr:hypothetical protein [Paraflavitalea sp. H1-2-19X]
MCNGVIRRISSTLYPNIFILKYLKSRGRATAAIEQRALKYIRSGYRKLLSFETSSGGFEWFGRAPGHLGLTAYGVLQFTDMKAFTEVDDKMLRRTREFLFRHRDSIGGFQHVKGAYGRFAHMQSAAADAYIVYALSNAGMGAEITQQYDTAVQKALRLKDGYLVTLMANAAVYQKKESDYQRLIKLANRLYRDSGLKASTGMVGSYGESLRTEVLALYAMALMHDKLTDKEVLYKVFGGMLEKRVTGFYGSTQSIVLTLEAVTQYRDFIRDLTDDVVIDFSVNENYTSVGSFSNFMLRTGDNVLTVRYDKGSSFVPYEFEAQYHTYRPPSRDRTVVALTTQLGDTVARVGSTVRMEVAVTNLEQNAQPMVVARIGIPAGLTAQTWQLKEMTEKQQVSYYEIFDNWLVFYWTDFKPAEVKKISLDLKAEIGGTFKGKASNVYLYYTPEEKQWNEGVGIRIDP